MDYFKVGLAARTQSFPDGRKPADSDRVYTLSKDGVQIFNAPFVTLNAGTTYVFEIDTPGYPFYITRDPHGGGVMRQPLESLAGSIEIIPESTGEKGNIGIEKGILRWTPDRNHAQIKLFYQCNYWPDMGNTLTVQLVE